MGRKRGGPPQVQQQNAQPWGPQGAQLQNLYNEARKLYESAPAQFYPGPTIAEFDPQELEAMALASERAREGSPSIKLATDYARGILSGDPAITSKVLGPKVGELLPGLQSQFNRAGMGASSLARSAEQELIARELSKLREDAANRLERLGGKEYEDFAKLAAMGEARREMEQAKIQEQLRRHEFAQNEPYSRLARYQQGVLGGFQTPEMMNQVYPIGGSRISGALGGASMGAGIGSLFGPFGAGLGGILGGVGGLF